MVDDWQDLCGIREQILANVSIAFPLISANGVTPEPHSDGHRYNLVIRHNNGNYQDVVLYGPSNDVFAFGFAAGSDRATLILLLQTTYGLIEQLQEQSKFAPVDNTQTPAFTSQYGGEKIDVMGNAPGMRNAK